MTDRVNTSQAIQRRHQGVYRDLYSRCFLVVSAPVKFFWAGEFGVHTGAPMIAQNLPLRVSVGIEQMKGTRRVEIVDQMYISSQDIFRSQMEQLHRRKLEKYIHDLLKLVSGDDNINSIRIHSLAEVSPSMGLGASSSFASALATALLLYMKKITPQDVTAWATLPTPQLPKNRPFDRTFRLSWKIASLLHDGISSGAASFFSFIGSVYPILYYSEKRSGFTALPQDVRVPLNIREHYELIDRLFYSGIRLDELFQWKHTPSWPIEFYLVFTGEKGGWKSAKNFSEIDTTLSAMNELVLKHFAYVKNDPSIFTPVFFEGAAASGWEGFHTQFIATSATLSLELLKNFKDLFEVGASERTLNDFFRNLNALQDALKIFRRSTPLVERINHSLNTRFLSAIDAHAIGVKLTGSGLGGDLVVATPSVEAHNPLRKELQALRRETEENIFLDYSVIRDGFEERGIIVEHYLEEKIYSDVIVEGSFVVAQYGKNGRTTLTVSIEEFERRKAEFPLLFDTTTNDIFVRGTMLTSKDVRSAKTTIAILRIAFAKLGHPVTKADLPASSYTADRNELQSKIVTPLQTTLQRMLKRVLPFKVSGPLRQYTVTLSNPTFDVFWLEKRL